MNREGLDAGLLANDYLANQESGLKIIGGTVARTEVQMLKKLLFRGTRGKALLNTFQLKVEDSDLMNKVDFGLDKNVGYIIIFQDSTNSGSSVLKICKSFQADVFNTTISGCERDLEQSLAQIANMRNLIGQSRAEFVNYLNVYNPLADADDVSLVMVYKQFLAKDQMIYKTLNMFKTCKTFLAGFIWVPTKKKE